MLALITTSKLSAEIAQLALLGQWLLGLLAGAKRDKNFFHQILQIMGKPFVRMARVILSQVRSGALQIKQPLNYFFLKGQAVTLLVFGQRRAALARFDAMLLLARASRYVLASRAQLLGETGDKHGATAALKTLTSIHPGNAAAWFNLGYRQGVWPRGHARC